LEGLALSDPPCTAILHGWVALVEDRKDVLPEVQSSLKTIRLIHAPSRPLSEAGPLLAFNKDSGVETVTWQISKWGFPVHTDLIKDEYNLWFLPEDMGYGMTPEIYRSLVRASQSPEGGRGTTIMAQCWQDFKRSVEKNRDGWKRNCLDIEAPTFTVDWKSIVSDRSKYPLKHFDAMVKYQPDVITALVGHLGRVISENRAAMTHNVETKLKEIRLIHNARANSSVDVDLVYQPTEKRLDVTWKISDTGFTKDLDRDFIRLFS
jgi:hypothetical protein